MNLHEFQGKQILDKYNVGIQKGIVAETPEKALDAAKKINLETGSNWFVIKAQVHAGGRGKGGGIKLAKSYDEVKKISSEILGMKLITPQTSKQGKLVNQVLVAQDVYYTGKSEPQEFYISIFLSVVF